MNLRVDRKADAPYLRLDDSAIVESEEVSPGVVLDYNESNEVVGVEYPDDKYGPSLLLLGITESGRPLHAQVSAADTPLVRIITLYEPNPDEWLYNTFWR